MRGSSAARIVRFPKRLRYVTLNDYACFCSTEHPEDDRPFSCVNPAPNLKEGQLIGVLYKLPLVRPVRSNKASNGNSEQVAGVNEIDQRRPRCAVFPLTNRARR